MFKKFSKYLPQIIAMLFLAGFVAYAWTEPGSPPPGGNVDTPINVGSASQLKSGALGIGGLFHAFSDAIFDAKVGIGTTNPQGILDVGGGKLVVTQEGTWNPQVTEGPRSPNVSFDDTSLPAGDAHWQDLKPSSGIYSVAFSGATKENDDLVSDVGIIGLLQSYSYYLRANNFGFSIPSNARIDGILVEIKRKASQNSMPFYGIADGVIKLFHPLTGLGANRALNEAWSASYSYKSYGSNADKWGSGWTPADINSSSFGVVMMVNKVGSDSEAGVTADVDHIRVTVYYTTPGGPDVVKMNSVTIRTDGGVSANLNADKLDSLNANDIMKKALFGSAGAWTSDQWHTANNCSCLFSYSPAYCTLAPDFVCLVGCNGTGYSLVKTAYSQLGGSGSAGYSFWSCQKD